MCIILYYIGCVLYDIILYIIILYYIIYYYIILFYIILYDIILYDIIQDTQEAYRTLVKSGEHYRKDILCLMKKEQQMESAGLWKRMVR